MSGNGLGFDSEILCSFLHYVLQSCEEAFFVSHQYVNCVTFMLTSLPNLTLNGGLSGEFRQSTVALFQYGHVL